MRKIFSLFALLLSVAVSAQELNCTVTVAVYDQIRLRTVIYDRIRQSYSAVYGAQILTL